MCGGATPQLDSQHSTTTDGDDLTALLYTDGYTTTARFGSMTRLSFLQAIFKRYQVNESHGVRVCMS